ncbi:ATP-binding protein [Lachnospiraceae bacterium PAL113]|uniref:ATP-binding protein n=2 Tax=Aequitasia blattaphilus TaxID=2949332 RepID=A0ABT1E8T3_9FIRM|nr:ATP-binding protein [Aequitasia blattaphilus]MCP1102039.1 ATP-binding protein [Aequitasia blattaphilus]MCR8614679.1 ATP-binding protein [Aequitasia blattaphilus]
MLIQFKFKNFKSFRDEVILDLSSAKMTEHSERVVVIGGEKILPVAAIYGANASGKTNVYEAFQYMKEYVCNSFSYGDEEGGVERFAPLPFLFDSDSKNEESSFEVFFIVPEDKTEKTYNYGFCVGINGVTEEWFNSKAKTARKFKAVYYRSKIERVLDLSGIPQASRNNIEIALEDETLISSLGAKLKIEKCKIIREWFIRNEFANFGDSAFDLKHSRLLPSGFVDDKKVRERIVNYLTTFDNSIKGFVVEKRLSDGESKKDTYSIATLHKKVDSDEMVGIPLQMESAGTLKMFSLYQELQGVLESGGVLVVDELNARLHPLLVRNFILAFLDPKINTNHAQLIFTSHDIWQLSNQLLRRDEIWFTEKNEQGISELYSLADFIDEDGSRIRKDENYEKNYLAGKYGAIPSLKSLDLVREG